MAQTNYRTINVDAYDPDSAFNFDISSLTPSVVPVSISDVQHTVSQIRQLLRGGDGEGALRGALESVPYGADEKGKETYAAAVTEILQSIRQSDIPPILNRLYKTEGGTELLDVLMKYLYKGMSTTATASSTSTPNSTRTQTPQHTGFSQMGGRHLGGADTGGQAMSVLLSWHEKLVEIAGPGSVVRVMTDRRTV